MASLPLSIHLPSGGAKKLFIEVDADKLERLLANFGFFNPEFLKSLDRAEKDYRSGRIKKIKSLKELR